MPVGPKIRAAPANCFNSGSDSAAAGSSIISKKSDCCIDTRHKIRNTKVYPERPISFR